MSSQRLLIKLSGEILRGPKEFGIDQKKCLEVAYALKRLKDAGHEIGIVIGGGNIFRGADLSDIGMERTTADHMGMLATLFNGLALEQSLNMIGSPSVVMSALECPQVVETYNCKRAISHLDEGKIVVFVGGTGNPYFTTDTAAALRAVEIHADLLLKATKVDGIYDKDPLKYTNAVKYDTMTYEEILAQKLKIMDATAIALCQSNRLKIYVFNMQRLMSENADQLLTNFSLGTVVE